MTAFVDLDDLTIATQTLPVPDGVDTVLLGLNNIVVHRRVERMLLAPVLGLAARLSLSPAAVGAVGPVIEAGFLRDVTTEDQWWDRLAWALGRDITPSDRAAYSALVAPNPHLDTMLTDLVYNGLRIGVLADTTSFWFKETLEQTNLGSYIDEDLTFTSHERGRTVAETPSLLGDAALVCDPATTLVVTDDALHLDLAREAGFHTLAYSFA